MNWLRYLLKAGKILAFVTGLLPRAVLLRGLARQLPALHARLDAEVNAGTITGDERARQLGAAVEQIASIAEGIYEDWKALAL